MFGFLKKIINLGRDLVVTPISIVQDVVEGDLDIENTSESLEDVKEDILDLFDVEEE